MKRRQSAGYTILEVMIVMAVTAAMLVAVGGAFSGRQGRTEMIQAVRDFESRIQTTVSDVASGNFPNGFDCQANSSGAAVTIATSSNNKPGANTGCIFLGKVMIMHKDTSDIFTVVGRQFLTTVGSADVKTLVEAQPQAVAKDGGPDVTYTYSHRLGLEVTKILKISDNSQQRGVGFMSELGSSASTNNPTTGSRSVLLYGMSGVAGASNTDSVLTSAGVINSSSTLIPAPEGIKICLSSSNGQKAEIIVGDNNNQTSTFVNLDSGVTSACA